MRIMKANWHQSISRIKMMHSKLQWNRIQTDIRQSDPVAKPARIERTLYHSSAARWCFFNVRESETDLPWLCCRSFVTTINITFVQSHSNSQNYSSCDKKQYRCCCRRDRCMIWCGSSSHVRSCNTSTSSTYRYPTSNPVELGECLVSHRATSSCEHASMLYCSTRYGR